MALTGECINASRSPFRKVFKARNYVTNVTVKDMVFVS
jgi:hypothetical protein